MWWAEGVAQYQYKGADHEVWDSHRDMILRDAALNGRLMSWSDAGHFGHPGIGNEMVYNTGYAFAIYLADRFGASVHANIARAARNKLRISFDRVLKDVTGIRGRELYGDFIDHISADYRKYTASISDHLREGEALFDEGPGNFLPSWSPDGQYLVFHSSQGYDYISYNFLYHLREDGKAKRISKDRVRGNVAWSPDGSKVYFAQRQKQNIYGSSWYDLMEYDFSTKKLQRLTHNARVYSVTTDERGNMFLIRVHDGTHNIYRFDPISGAMDALTAFTYGEQVYMMHADPKGQYIYFDMAINHGRDIYRLDTGTGQITPLIFDNICDNRTPFVTADGNTLYYASDRTGIFNIYRADLNNTSAEHELLTNVTGAAMYPAIDPVSSTLAYTLFREGRFGLYRLDSPLAIPREHAEYKEYRLPTRMQHSAEPGPVVDAKPYEHQFTNLFFMPFLQYDYNALKAGLIIYQNEILDKMGLFAMGDINYRGDYDINVRLDFNQFLPRFFAEIYAVGLARTDTINYLDYYPMEQKIRFTLYEAIVGMHYTWRSRHYFELTGTHGSYTSNIKGYLDDTNLLKFVPYAYYKGQRIEFRYRSDYTVPHWQRNISPTRGFRINNAVLAYDLNQYIDDFKVTDYGTYKETYTKHYTPRAELNADLFLPLPFTSHSALSFNVNAGAMFNTEIDSFFNFYAGGLPGLKGYPYYAIEGTHKLIFTSTLRFPLSKRLGLNLEPFFFESLYLGVYHQIGDAWTLGLSDPQWKQNIGLEARIGGHSWYGFPLALSLDLVYALNTIEYKEFDEIRTIGHNFRFYWTLLFDF
jgi:hypothetical protein